VIARRGCLQAGVAALAAAAWPASWAQAYPNKPVRVLVGYTPGSATDLYGRAIAKQLQQTLGQPFVVDNKPGAAGNIAVETVVRAPADGYTVLNSASQIVINPFVQKLSYDTEKDLIPVAQTISVSYVLVTRPDFPAADLPALLAHVKKHPRKLNYGSYGAGSGPHLSMVMLARAAGMEMEHIQYRGSPQMLLGLMAGEVDMAFDTSTSVASHVQSGKLKAVAVAGPRPVEVIPGVQPIARTFPGFDTDGWQGLFVPTGTPSAVVERLAAEVGKALRTDELKSFSAARGVHLVGSTPEQFSAYMRQELRKYEQVVRENNIQVG